MVSTWSGLKEWLFFHCHHTTRMYSFYVRPLPYFPGADGLFWVSSKVSTKIGIDSKPIHQQNDKKNVLLCVLEPSEKKCPRWVRIFAFSKPLECCITVAAKNNEFCRLGSFLHQILPNKMLPCTTLNFMMTGTVRTI
jgi:hypothetical protein